MLTLCSKVVNPMRDAIETFTSHESNTPESARFVYDEAHHTYLCEGAWSVLSLKSLSENFTPVDAKAPQTEPLIITGAKLEKFDSAGALALLRCIATLKKNYEEIKLEHFTDAQQELIRLVESKENTLREKKLPSKTPKKGEEFLEMLGQETLGKIEQFDGLVQLVGDLTDKLFIASANWKRFQWPSIVSNVNSTGLRALPIIALLSFLIGVVLAYQMGLQLETYGATSFISYISGMAIFREFGPLITAIIVAGRTSSSFTAQIGSMKINQELDALTTMGLSPTELLVLPKVIGLLLILPFVIFWADVFSILGAMIMAKNMLQVGYYDFLVRLQTDVGADQLMLGLYKAPAFAILVALVGCFQGFRVKTNANSIGSQTTKSVVQALFLIIITDAVYSIIYSWMDL